MSLHNQIIATQSMNLLIKNMWIENKKVHNSQARYAMRFDSVTFPCECNQLIHCLVYVYRKLIRISIFAKYTVSVQIWYLSQILMLKKN